MSWGLPPLGALLIMSIAVMISAPIETSVAMVRSGVLPKCRATMCSPAGTCTWIRPSGEVVSMSTGWSSTAALQPGNMKAW